MAPVENNNKITINTRATVIGCGLLLLEDGELLVGGRKCWCCLDQCQDGLKSFNIILSLLSLPSPLDRIYFCSEEEGSLAGGRPNFP